MAKRKALGQDPLAWIKLTQQTETPPEKPDETKGGPGPQPAGRRATMNWAFLVIYVVNMLLLLALVFLIHADLTSRLSTLRTELHRLEGEVRQMEQFDAASPPGAVPAP